MEASSTRVTERARRTGAFALVVAATIGLASAAFAQGAASTARADELFTQGKAALEAGDLAHACPKLAESYRIDPSNGTLLALALCHEGLGLTATAWREFGAAVDGATKDGRADRAQFARTHMATLETRLSRLTVSVPAEAPPGLGVEVDGAALAPGDWGKASPIDPGHHTIAAHATGRKPWTGGVDVGADRDAQTVKIGALAPEAVVPPVAPAPAPAAVATPAPVYAPSGDTTPGPDTRSADGAWKRPAGWIAGAAGVIAVGVGASFGVIAISKSSDAKKQCSPQLCTSSAAVDENNDARSAATISDITIGVGLAAIAAGAYFLLTAPSAHPAAASVLVAPFVGHQQAGLAFEQAW